ncbi:polyprenyl synthetase family protein [Ectobacillus funiculus]|jgi:competence protein ComQ|uniref:Polyprenyl synthetase family protein n=1 Tax=Ectobacillus funiculus TaxID=137993 RepID=A0ABV5WHM6_9BACI
MIATEHLIQEKQLQQLYADCFAYKKKQGSPFRLITLQHYKVFGGTSPDIQQIADAVEQLILSLDIIDDWQDEDLAEAAPWMKIEKAQALNIALLFLNSSMNHIIASSFQNQNAAARCMHQCLNISIEGQYLDIENAISNEEQYIIMCRKKSGSLLTLASLLGSLLATDNVPACIASYASDMGVAAQIANDMRDAVNITGKSDWRKKKRTLPILYLLHPKVEKGQLVRDYFAGTISFEELAEREEELVHIVKSSGALVYANAVRELHQNQAIAAIDSLQVNRKSKQALKEIFLQKL